MVLTVNRYSTLCWLVALACASPDISLDDEPAHDDDGPEVERGRPPALVRWLASPPIEIADEDAAAGTPDAGAPQEIDAGMETPERAPPVFGLTVTNPWAATESSALVDELATFDSPTVRVVFDSGVDRVLRTYAIDASAYEASVAAIGARSRVMGELLDSFFFPLYTVDQFRARACEYRAALGHLVDVWELGNEINGEWLGADVEAKLISAIEVFRADRASYAAMCPGFALRADERPFELALTLYYNGERNGGVASVENCWANPDHAMLDWARSRMTGQMASVDYVFVSFYEDDCHGAQPDWQRVFDELGAIVPDARLGIGECGTRSDADKVRYVERYYGGMESALPEHANMRVDHPRFVGGYFWWYLSDDLDQPAVLDALRASQDLSFWSSRP